MSPNALFQDHPCLIASVTAAFRRYISTQLWFGHGFPRCLRTYESREDVLCTLCYWPLATGLREIPNRI
jgi:hypothetical protein